MLRLAASETNVWASFLWRPRVRAAPEFLDRVLRRFVVRVKVPEASHAHLVDRLDDAPQNVTQTAPVARDARHQIALSRVNAVVSRVGIAPERRSRRLKPECLRITGRDHVETW